MMTRSAAVVNDARDIAIPSDLGGDGIVGGQDDRAAHAQEKNDSKSCNFCVHLLPATASGALRFSGCEEIPQAHVGRNHDIVETDHHFFPALLAEFDSR